MKPRPNKKVGQAYKIGHHMTTFISIRWLQRKRRDLTLNVWWFYSKHQKMPINEATKLLACHHMSLIYRGTLFLSHILERPIRFASFPIASDSMK